MIAPRAHTLSKAEQLARAIQADPRERARLAEAHGVPDTADASLIACDMRRRLDRDVELRRVPTDLLQSRSRSAYLVKLRIRAVSVLHPHFTDEAIARFLNRKRCAVTYLRRTHL